MKIKMWKAIFAQLIATSGVLVLMIQIGNIDSWTSPNIARWTQENATIALTSSEASWLATSFTLGKFASVILVPILNELAGSRKTTIYTFIPVSVCWVMMMTASSAMYFYIARFLSGITHTLTCVPFLYLGEITMPSLRGTFISITLTGWCIGAVVTSFNETYLPRVVSCTIYLVPCLLGILIFAWLPESPYQLVKNKDLQKAHETLEWFRGHKQTKAEMEEIVEYVESTSKITRAEKLKQLKSPVIRKSMALVTLVKVIPELCGFYNVTYFMEDIVNKGKSLLANPSDIVIYINVIGLVATIITVKLIDKYGRRTLILISSTVITLALLGLSLHHYLLNDVQVDPVRIQVLSIASIILLSIVFTIGYTPVMLTLFGEMFPHSIKGTAVMIVTLVNNFIGFISTLSYQFFIDTIGETYLFLMYASLLALSIPIFLYFMPETKGKSLQEIQNDLNKKN